MKFRTISIAASIGFLACGCASWHERGISYAPGSVDGGDSDAAWTLLDTNHDGALGRDELAAQGAVGLLRDLVNADGNHDGTVSRGEWNTWWPRMTRTPASPTMARLNLPSQSEEGRGTSAQAPSPNPAR